MFISINFVPLLLARIGIIEAGLISPVFPIKVKISAISVSLNEQLFAGSGIDSPKKTKSGFNRPEHSIHLCGRMLNNFSLASNCLPQLVHTNF